MTDIVYTDPTTAGNIVPLASNFAIVDKNGYPTQYFMKWAQQRSQDIAGAPTVDDVENLIGQFAEQVSIETAAPITGGGTLLAPEPIGMASISNLAGSYTSADITVDEFGRVTVAANGSGSQYTFVGGGVSASVPIGTPTLVQVSPGIRTDGGGTLELPEPATAGNTLLIVYCGSTTGPNTPVAFTLEKSGNVATQEVAIYSRTAGGGETSVGVSSNDNGQWVLYEFTEITTFDLSTQSFSFPLEIPATLNMFTLFAVEQDSTVPITIDPGDGYVIDYQSPGTGGNHNGGIGHTTSTETVTVAGSTDGSTNIFGLITISGPAAGGVTTVTIPGVEYGSGQVTSIAAGSNITLGLAGGVLTITGGAGSSVEYEGEAVSSISAGANVTMTLTDGDLEIASTGGGGGGGGSGNAAFFAAGSYNPSGGSYPAFSNLSGCTVTVVAAGIYDVTFDTPAPDTEYIILTSAKWNVDVVNGDSYPSFGVDRTISASGEVAKTVNGFRIYQGQYDMEFWFACGYPNDMTSGGGGSGGSGPTLVAGGAFNNVTELDITGLDFVNNIYTLDWTFASAVNYGVIYLQFGDGASPPNWITMSGGWFQSNNSNGGGGANSNGLGIGYAGGAQIAQGFSKIMVDEIPAGGTWNAIVGYNYADCEGHGTGDGGSPTEPQSLRLYPANANTFSGTYSLYAWPRSP